MNNVHTILGFVLLLTGSWLSAGNPGNITSAMSGSSLKEGLNCTKGNPAGITSAKESASSLKKDLEPHANKRKSLSWVKTRPASLKTEKPPDVSKPVDLNVAAFQKKDAIIKADASCKTDTHQRGLSGEAVKGYFATLDGAEREVVDSLVGKYIDRGYEDSGAASSAVLEFHGLLKAYIAHLK